jgi:6,7-dimethyl-8-ribityllumazine synthase
LPREEFLTVNIIEGRLLTNNDQFGIVVSRFNELITSRLLDGAIDTLCRHGAERDQLTIVHVPGAFEIPVIADRLAQSGKFHAVICLGAVIQGETTHHEYINHQVAAAIMQAGQASQIPVTFGVLTCPTMEHALDRAGGKAGNKGVEAALAAIEMVDVLRRLSAAGL